MIMGRWHMQEAQDTGSPAAPSRFPAISSTPTRRLGRPVPMSEWLPETPRTLAFPTAAYVTLAGADWLASASPHPDEMHALWATRPAAPERAAVRHRLRRDQRPRALRAADGRPFMVRRSRLGAGGGAPRPDPALRRSGHGPAAARAARLGGVGHRRPAAAVPRQRRRGHRPAAAPLSGAAEDAPAIGPFLAAEEPSAPAGSRWLVAPDVRDPWLPGPDVLLWACVRAARSVAGPEQETAAQHPVPALTRG